MENNWNLSDKMESNSPELIEEYDLNNDEIDWFYKKDVKESFKIIKEENLKLLDFNKASSLNQFINKIIGDKLQ